MIRLMSSSLIQLVYVVLSFGVLMALVMISKLCVIYPYALNKVAAYLKDRGGGNWYRFNKEAMRMGLGRMLSGMVIVWAIGLVILLVCLPSEFRQVSLIGGVLGLFVSMLAEWNTRFSIGTLDCVDVDFNKKIYFRDAHEKEFSCSTLKMFKSKMEMLDLREKALRGRHFAVLTSRFYDAVALIEKTEWE